MWVKYGFSTLCAVNSNIEDGIMQIQSVEKLRPVESTYCSHWGTLRTLQGRADTLGWMSSWSWGLCGLEILCHHICTCVLSAFKIYTCYLANLQLTTNESCIHIFIQYEQWIKQLHLMWQFLLKNNCNPTSTVDICIFWLIVLFLLTDTFTCLNPTIKVYIKKAKMSE